MAKRTFTIAAIVSVLALGACASPEGQRMETSYGAYRQCLINRNADFGACAQERAIFEADEQVYNDYTARRAAEPDVVFTGGGGGVGYGGGDDNGQAAAFWNMVGAQAEQQNAFWNMVGATRP